MPIQPTAPIGFIDGSLFPVVIIGAIILFAVGAYFGWKAEMKRREELAALAAEMGFSFDHEKDSSHDDRYAQFEIFRRGHSRVAFNTMQGQIDLLGSSCDAILGDFRYRVTRNSGKSSSTTTYRFSYLIVHLPWDCPPLLIRPEGIFDKVAGAFGFDDIDFESEEFSRRFYVKSPDKRFAYDVLHPRMMEFMLASAPPMIDLEDGAVCLSGGKKRWSVEVFRERIRLLEKFCELWPRHLLRDLES